MSHYFKLRRFLVSLLIFTILMSSSVFAKEDKGTGQSEVLKLSLDDAIKLAEETNPMVKISQIAVDKAKLSRSEVRYRDRKAKDGESESYEYKSKIELAEKQADFGILMAEIDVDATLRNIRYEVESAYYNALAAKENLSIAEETLKRQKDMLKIAEAKFQVGTIAKKDVLDTQVQLAKANADLLKAESGKEKSYINLKKLLQIDMDKKIELTDSFNYKSTDEDIDLKKLIAEAKENRRDIIQAQGLYDIAQLDFDLTSKAYTPNTFFYKEKEQAMEEAKMKLDDTKSNVEAEVRGIVLDYLEAKANIPVLEKSVDMAKESLRLAKLSYEAGIIRSVDVAAAEEGYRQTVLNRSQVIYSYNLAKLRLKNVVFMPVGFSL